LIPGFGAQGGKGEDVAAAFRPDGLGAVVNSSRAILFPGNPADPSWEQNIEKATRDAIAALPPISAAQPHCINAVGQASCLPPPGRQDACPMALSKHSSSERRNLQGHTLATR